MVNEITNHEAHEQMPLYDKSTIKQIIYDLFNMVESEKLDLKALRVWSEELKYFADDDLETED